MNAPTLTMTWDEEAQAWHVAVHADAETDVRITVNGQEA